jgi:hypothetical protein
LLGLDEAHINELSGGSVFMILNTEGRRSEGRSASQDVGGEMLQTVGLNHRQSGSENDLEVRSLQSSFYRALRIILILTALYWPRMQKIHIVILRSEKSPVLSGLLLLGNLKPFTSMISTYRKE